MATVTETNILFSQTVLFPIEISKASSFSPQLHSQFAAFPPSSVLIILISHLHFNSLNSYQLCSTIISQLKRSNRARFFLQIGPSYVGFVVYLLISGCLQSKKCIRKNTKSMYYCITSMEFPLYLNHFING